MKRFHSFLLNAWDDGRWFDHPDVIFAGGKLAEWIRRIRWIIARWLLRRKCRVDQAVKVGTGPLEGIRGVVREKLPDGSVVVALDGLDENSTIQIAGLEVPVAYRIEILPVYLRNVPATEDSTDKFLTQVGSLVPRQHREAILGDLWEDVADYRADGWSEARIRWHLCWQLTIAVLQRLPLTKAAIIAWIARNLRSLVD